MKIDFNHTLVDLDQKPIKNGQANFILKDAATTALLADFSGEQISGQEKAVRFSLATKIHGANGHPLDLDLDDVKLVRDLIAKAYPPLVAGQVWQLLNGDIKEE
jgi:hypothetical protein